MRKLTRKISRQMTFSFDENTVGSGYKKVQLSHHNKKSIFFRTSTRHYDSNELSFMEFCIVGVAKVTNHLKKNHVSGLF